MAGTLVRQSRKKHLSWPVA